MKISKKMALMAVGLFAMICSRSALGGDTPYSRDDSAQQVIAFPVCVLSARSFCSC